MYQNLHPANSPTAIQKNVRRWRGVLLALMLILIVGSVGQPAQAAPSQDTIWILPKLEASPGTITLCPNESTYIYVTYREDQYRASNLSAPVQGQPVSGVTINGSVINPNVGHLVRATTTTQTWRAGTTALFRIVAGSSFGRTTVRFEAGAILAPLEGPNGENLVLIPPTPITVSLEVKCKYLVQAFSSWVLPGERQLYTLGILAAVVTPDANGHFSNIPGTMTSSAAWVGPCPGTSTIQPSTADISGYVGQDKFTAEINYQPAQTSTTEGCKGKSSSGPGQPQPLQFEVPASGGTDTEPNHILDTYVAVSGTSNIVVIPLGP
jgi:hypothetical protein